ncbi:energy transducer TonB [Dyella sp. C11]|uniref:energy transducer TonB n=1 Tax=Dyella sp. C11 TaxID=2126991 RepID=UPI000D65C23B|nr:energy transducer TonB [Dyella sp. C11]
MHPASSRRCALGIARYSLLILIVLIAAAGGLIYRQIKQNDDADQPKQATVAAAGPVMRAGLGTDDLLQHARDAMAAQRLLAPAGNNAIEFYLAVLKREPGNRVAQDALREVFPFAAHAAEQTIDTGDDAEAQRQIDLLTRADPQNYTVTLLQAKLQAQRAAVAQQAQQAQQQANRREPSPSSTSKSPAPAPAAPVVVATPTPAPPVTPAPAPAAPSKPAVTSNERAIAQLNVESTKIEAAPRAAVHARTPTVTTPLADANGTSVPVLTRRVEPTYPPDAKRTRRQGWVDVTFVVQPDGTVSSVAVADADPKYVFDRAALSAVARWQFAPGTQDGKPVALPMRQRIEFRL